MKVNTDIASCATLVSLRIRKIGGTKVNRAESQNYASQHNMDSGSVVTSFRLFTPADLKPISSVCNNAKSIRDKYTLPWNDLGQRMCPNSVFTEFNQHMVRLKDEFTIAVRDLENDYPRIIEDAKIRLNGKFNSSDYPEYISDRFDFNMEVSPMPLGNGLRIEGLPEADLKKLQDERDRETMEIVRKSATEVVERMKEAIEVLIGGTDGKGGLMNKDARFHQSSIDRVVEILDMAPSLNILGNEHLDNLVEDVKKTLKPENMDADLIRKDETIRNQVMCDSVQAVSKIQECMAGF